MSRVSYSADRLRTLATGAVAVVERPAVLGVAGPGATECLQGLLTNDLAGAGPAALLYAALLTPKGMITTDCWVLRRDNDFTLLLDRAALPVVRERFARTLPPRLARVTDRSGDDAVLWLLGPESTERLAAVAGPPPSPGGVAPLGEHGLVVGTPLAPRAPFRHLLTGAAPLIEGLADRLVAAGAVRGTVDDLRVARVRSGFPSLGAEIDEKTMPAEVDFDALLGVSHKKGCYVGQETVARLHFRGHANWLLRGLRGGSIPDGEISAGGKPVARIGTVVRVGGEELALARVRRELEPGSVLDGSAGPLTVVALPFEG